MDEVLIDGRARIEELQRVLSTMPQAEGMVTTHHFVPGQYLRKLWRPKSVIIIGKVHKAHHFFLCAMGEIAVSSGDGNWKVLQAGDVIESQPGTKRITVALTDAIGITVHKTDLTDLDEIEAELIEFDELALFDARNELKISKIENTIGKISSG